jgi:hypothetical protein
VRFKRIHLSGILGQKSVQLMLPTVSGCKIGSVLTFLAA